MAFSLVITDTGGREYTYTDILNFSFSKDVYTPFTSLNISCYMTVSVNNINRVRFYHNNKLIHDGLVDKVKFDMGAKRRSVLTVSSSGFTSLLAQNYITPGMYSDLTFDSLMDSFITLPFVQHEADSSKTNYIFVKPKSTMWDAVVNYCFKVYKRYPYIDGPNTVRISARGNPAVYSQTTKNSVSYGYTNNYTQMLSDFHMEDTHGTYNTYNLNNDYATRRYLVRHKHFELDNQYYSNPDEALDFRNNYAQRQAYATYCEYYGYNGEDINDKFTMVSGTPMIDVNISKIQIIATGNLVKTTIISNYDPFNNFDKLVVS